MPVQLTPIPPSTLERRTQRAYRYGLALLCIGALLNWLGFAQGSVEPVRYLGVGCVIAGAFCICAAMCRWLGRPGAGSGAYLDSRSIQRNSPTDVHVIAVSMPVTLSGDYLPNQSVHRSMLTKPPDYETVAAVPPPYEEAIKLSPLHLTGVSSNNSNSDNLAPTSSALPTGTGNSDDCRQETALHETNEPPPPYVPSAELQQQQGNETSQPNGTPLPRN